MRRHRGRAACAAVLIAGSTLLLSGAPSSFANHLSYVQPTEWEVEHGAGAEPARTAEADYAPAAEPEPSGYAYAESGLADAMAAIRWCESSNDYSANTGNGYYGAYQFSLETWWWLGYAGYPDQAPPNVQDEAALVLYGIYGWTPWPSCAAYLGLL
jgi:hypothetical protein